MLSTSIKPTALCGPASKSWGKMNHRIIIAESRDQFRSAQTIVAAYAEYLGIDLSFQNFAGEMAEFSDMYGLPSGSMILLEVDGSVVGAVGLRRFSEGVAEMKRMFILPQYQGNGFGNSLIRSFIERARELNYKSIKLDTIPRLDKAFSLYRKFGFQIVEPYRFNPDPETLYMELVLS